MENKCEEIQEMDTTAAGSDSIRKRRRDQASREAGDKARKTVVVTATTTQPVAAPASEPDVADDIIVDDDAGKLEGLDNEDVQQSTECPGWTVVVSRRAKKQQASEGSSPQRGLQPKGKPSVRISAPNTKAKEEKLRAAKAQFVSKVNASMAKNARMPSFACKDEFRVVIRPRGGLVVASTTMTILRGAIITAAKVAREEAEEDSIAPNVAQNIVVLSTPCESRANKYGMIRVLTIGAASYETYAYRSTPDDTSRGVISGVGHEESEEDIRRCIVNKHNPTAMAAHRLGNSTSVVILFEGQKVPHYVKYGGFVTKCTLYRQHREVCKICGQVGHRKDVCPTPNARVCFACGRKNPGEDHKEYCKPKCKLCGGSHVTGTGSCKNKFKTPIQIKQRQWAKQNAEARTNAKMRPTPLHTPKVRLSRRDDFPELESRHDGSNVASRDWKTMTSENDGMTWADVNSAGTKTTQRQRSASRRREAQKQERGESAKANGDKTITTRRERSTSRGNDASLPSPTPRNKEAEKVSDGRKNSGECGQQCKRNMDELKIAMRKMQNYLARTANQDGGDAAHNRTTAKDNRTTQGD
ncbi:hypothetical protein HPB48_025059 [Haemaphysalis longicornis]|uniref:CCHC-type domain-containing protein n=1 Tax=Haemaphysalis longicornis TaxID=44386 RepID=A0A9J6H8T3_HAELO|nr:hypothetical protein HPB48_025059 [Haemaphysalis longicornis]